MARQHKYRMTTPHLCLPPISSSKSKTYGKTFYFFFSRTNNVCSSFSLVYMKYDVPLDEKIPRVVFNLDEPFGGKLHIWCDRWYLCVVLAMFFVGNWRRKKTCLIHFYYAFKSCQWKETYVSSTKLFWREFSLT